MRMVEGGDEKIIVIGAGITGVQVAHMWDRMGYDVTILEAHSDVGGLWSQCYPKVRLQNTFEQYRFPDYEWPFTPSRHPTAEEFLRYLKSAVKSYKLDVRCNHRVTKVEEVDKGWVVHADDTVNSTPEEFFCSYLHVAVGQYPFDSKYRPKFKGEEDFKGDIITTFSSPDTASSVFSDKQVVVYGYGKTALDFISWAGEYARHATHVFRKPHWLIPDKIRGVCHSKALLGRNSTDMMPSWTYGTGPQTSLQTKAPSAIVRGFWNMIAGVMSGQHMRNAGPIRDIPTKGLTKAEIDRRLQLVFGMPKETLLKDFRSSVALCPDNYAQEIAQGKILPIQDEIEEFYDKGVILKSGERVEAELVALCLGNKAVDMDFLPSKYRKVWNSEADGCPPQLFRHLVHPEMRPKRLGFAGYNHSLVHPTMVEVGTLWQIAVYRGELELPSPEKMLESIDYVKKWKDEHIEKTPMGYVTVGTRFQQYADTILGDLCLKRYRKMPNPFGEYFGRYQPDDYKTIVDEYLKDTVGKVRQVNV